MGMRCAWPERIVGGDMVLDCNRERGPRRVDSIIYTIEPRQRVASHPITGTRLIGCDVLIGQEPCMADTTRLFKCPTCGGPLEPPEGQSAMKCPYCANTVIVPESLRIPAKQE